MTFKHASLCLHRTALFLAAFGLLFYAGAASASQCSTTDCHAALTAQRHLHSPETTRECDLCHKRQNEAHPSGNKTDFSLVAAGSALCLECHEGFEGSAHTHMPVDEGECTLCHKPHSSNDDNLTALCASCHETFDQPHLHGPVAVGDCTICHDPHTAAQSALLRKPSRQLCLGCHADFAEGMASSPVIHTPVAEQSCTACHDPHQSQHPNLLSGQMPDICFNCHEKVKETAQRSRNKHPILFTDSSCGTCHSTHFSSSPGLLALSQQDLCLSCHGEDNYKKSDALANIAREIANKDFLHGPLEDGKCDGCHDPHGSDNYRMLRGKYPEGFYAPYEKGSYGLCLSCHDSYLLSYPDTTLYTNFRNGELNLHYLHVNKTRKGRTCRACHEPHASNQAKLVSTKGPEFGNWNIPTSFQKTETGGSCTPGCHRQVAYDREKPVAYE